MKKRTWEQKVAERQRELIAQGCGPIDAYELAKAYVNKRQKRAAKVESDNG